MFGLYYINRREKMKSLPVKLKIFLGSIYVLTIASLLIFINYNYVSLEMTTIIKIYPLVQVSLFN